MYVAETSMCRCAHELAGHNGEISSAQFNFSGDLCVTGSIDMSVKIWSVATGECVRTLTYVDERAREHALRCCVIMRMCSRLR
jgi:WD40 repeat protein